MGKMKQEHVKSGPDRLGQVDRVRQTGCQAEADLLEQMHWKKHAGVGY